MLGHLLPHPSSASQRILPVFITEPCDESYQMFWCPGGARGGKPGASAAQPLVAERSEEHTSELQSRQYLVCRLLLEKKNSQPQTPCNLTPSITSGIYGRSR